MKKWTTFFFLTFLLVTPVFADVVDAPFAVSKCRDLLYSKQPLKIASVKALPGGHVFFMNESVKHCPSLHPECLERYRARVKSEQGGRVYFINDFSGEGCPSTQSKCLTRSYVVKTDRVIIAHQYKDYTCSWFEPQNPQTPGTIGFLPTAALNIEQQEPAKPTAAVMGGWQDGRNVLLIEPAMEGVKLSGEAFWQGAAGQVNTGYVDGFAQLVGNHISLNGACSVEARQIGEFLVVSSSSSSGGCGGANVSFTGVYTKMTTKPVFLSR